MIWRRDDPTSTINSRKMMTNGMMIPSLMLSIYRSEARNHHRAKAQLSHMNILAGLILKNMNATKIAIKIAITVVAI
jgi:hypothetical protein